MSLVVCRSFAAVRLWLLLCLLAAALPAAAHERAFFGSDGAYAPELQRSGDRVASVLAARHLHELAIGESQAAAIKLPLLAMRGGEKDDPRDTVERLVAINPAVKMIRVESEDHVSLLTSDRFMQALQDFLLQQITPVSTFPSQGVNP